MLSSVNLKRTFDQNVTLFLWHGFVNFTEKEPCTKFHGVFVRFDEVIKLQAAEFSESDIITADVQNISSLIFFSFFC